MIVKLRGKPFDITIIQVYAPTADKSDGELDQFYEQLEKAKSQCKSQQIIFVLGDLNEKVGNEKFGNMVGKFGLGEINERGKKWRQWCKTKNQVIFNTWLQHHPRR